jgi:hypothetical protein
VDSFHGILLDVLIDSFRRESIAFIGLVSKRRWGTVARRLRLSAPR